MLQLRLLLLLMHLAHAWNQIILRDCPGCRTGDRLAPNLPGFAARGRVSVDGPNDICLTPAKEKQLHVRSVRGRRGCRARRRALASAHTPARARSVCDAGKGCCAKEAKEKERREGCRVSARTARLPRARRRGGGPRGDDGPRLRRRARGGRGPHAARRRRDELRRAREREEGEVEEKCAELAGTARLICEAGSGGGGKRGEAVHGEGGGKEQTAWDGQAMQLRVLPRTGAAYLGGGATSRPPTRACRRGSSCCAEREQDATSRAGLARAAGVHPAEISQLRRRVRLRYGQTGSGKSWTTGADTRRSRAIHYHPTMHHTAVSDARPPALRGPAQVRSLLAQPQAARRRALGLHAAHPLDTHAGGAGALNLADLTVAGSERLVASVAGGERLKETQRIDRSLRALSRGRRRGPARMYPVRTRRHEKLTYLLRNSLSGNSKMLMVLSLSPLAAHLNESLTSLRLATKREALILDPAQLVVRNHGALVLQHRKTKDRDED
ncbi:P-loop containing nucleoside triphosphate hydrolase protein [Mycena latifolia]|nr:P-loop containing nucleoside triphosphate hydrolase protein [Mycena latifolia]